MTSQNYKCRDDNAWNSRLPWAGSVGSNDMKYLNPLDHNVHCLDAFGEFGHTSNLSGGINFSILIDKIVMPKHNVNKRIIYLFGFYQLILYSSVIHK